MVSDGTPILIGDDMTEAELIDTAEHARDLDSARRQNMATAQWLERCAIAEETARRARVAAWHAENQRLGL